MNVLLNVLLLSVDAFDELTEKFCNLLVMYVLCYLILCLLCKFTVISNGCQDIANSLQRYFNLSHPVVV